MGKNVEGLVLESNKNLLLENQTSEQKEIVANLNNFTPRAHLAYIYKNKRIVMVCNRIYDLKDLLHPGGNFLWDFNNWCEVSRYMIESYSDERDFYARTKGYNHSAVAYKWLEKYCFIGKLEPFKNAAEWNLYNLHGVPDYSENQPWKKVNQKQISKTTMLYEFQNENFVLNQ